MEAAEFAAFFDNNQLSNRKQSLVEPLTALYTSPFVYSINLLVQMAVAPNYKRYRTEFITSFPHWISRNMGAPST